MMLSILALLLRAGSRIHAPVPAVTAIISHKIAAIGHAVATPLRHPILPPLPSPAASPNKKWLAVYSSGCATFEHRQARRKHRSPIRRREGLRGRIDPRRLHRCSARGRSKLMFLWTAAGVACGGCLPRRAAAYASESATSRRSLAKRTRGGAVRALPHHGPGRSCYDRASQTKSIATRAGSRRGTTPLWPMQQSPAR